MSDLGVDVHNAAVPPGLHCWQDGPAEQHRALDEEVRLGQVAGPGDLGHCGFGLRAGGVEDQHTDRAEVGGDRGNQPGDLALVGDIGAEARRGAAIITDGAADRSYLFVAGPAIDRGAVLRLFAGQDFSTDAKGVFWTGNPLGNGLHDTFPALASARVLERRGAR